LAVVAAGASADAPPRPGLAGGPVRRRGAFDAIRGGLRLRLTGMLAPNLAEAWRYRNFIASSIRSDFRARFVRSRLGGLWMIIHPLAQAAIFALVLAEVMAIKLPGMAGERHAYAIYLLSGMLGWSLFAEVIGRCLTLFIDNGSLLKKMVFPRITLPLIAAGSALVDNLLLFVAVIAVFAVVGFVPGPMLAWIAVLTLLTLGLALGIGLTLGVFNVFVRDVGQIVPVVLQLGFWFTPIVYTPEVVPAGVRPLLALNPMTTLVQGYQNAILFGRPPDFAALGGLALITFFLLVGALIMFRRASAEMVDVL
jgi:lipopolysaccharide transport system permease protein